MRRSRTPRVARGAVVASVATFTALLSHVVAGGALPGPAGIAAPWLLAFMASTLLAGRNLSVVRLGLSVVVSQVLFHTLFVMGAALPAAASMPAMSPHAHDHAHGAMGMTMDAAAAPSASGWLSALCADPAMWALHAVAAAMTIGLLYRGERAARALLAVAADIRAWARRVVARAAAVPRIAPPAPFLAETIGWIVRPAAHAGDDRRRGPPPLLAL